MRNRFVGCPCVSAETSGQKWNKGSKADLQSGIPIFLEKNVPITAHFIIPEEQCVYFHTAIENRKYAAAHCCETTYVYASWCEVVDDPPWRFPKSPESAFISNFMILISKILRVKTASTRFKDKGYFYFMSVYVVLIHIVPFCLFVIVLIHLKVWNPDSARPVYFRPLWRDYA